VIKAEFSASLLQSSVSHDPSEITLIFKKHLWLLSVLKTVHVSLETDTFYFSGFFDELKVQKNSIYLKYNLL